MGLAAAQQTIITEQMAAAVVGFTPNRTFRKGGPQESGERQDGAYKSALRDKDQPGLSIAEDLPHNVPDGNS